MDSKNVKKVGYCIVKIITITNRKGGSGKTATSLALGYGLVLKGYKVLFIDADSQCNLTTGIIGRNVTYEISLLDVLQGKADIATSLLEIDSTSYLLPSSGLLADIARQRGISYTTLKAALNRVAPIFDYCIIDTAPASDLYSVSAIMVSDNVIIPTTPDIDSYEGINKVSDIVKTVQESGSAVTCIGILITRYSGRSVLDKGIVKSIEKKANELGTRVYKSKIRECVAVRKAKFKSTDIYSYAPRSNAASDYQAFIDEFLESED